MESLRECIEKVYDTIHDTNNSEKEHVETKKKRIFASITIATTVAGVIGSVVMGGPLFLGLFNRTIAEAGLQIICGLVAGGATSGSLGGASIGVGVNKLLPRKWCGSEFALNEAIKSLKNSQNDIIVKKSIHAKTQLPQEIETMSNDTVPETLEHSSRLFKMYGILSIALLLLLLFYMLFDEITCV